MCSGFGLVTHPATGGLLGGTSDKGRFLLRLRSLRKRQKLAPIKPLFGQEMHDGAEVTRHQILGLGHKSLALCPRPRT